MHAPCPHFILRSNTPLDPEVAFATRLSSQEAIRHRLTSVHNMNEKGQKSAPIRSWFQRNLKGWRSGILRGAVLALAVFIINLSLTILAFTKSKSLSNGQRIIYEGDCKKVQRVDTAIHLVINILSTLLLGAGNFAMQCLSAPTRQEVDKAHENRIWLDIGILSLRNLRRISSKRVTLYVLLAIFSLPLNLFYNSTFFASVYASDYLIITVSPDMLSKNASSHTLGLPPWSNSTYPAPPGWEYSPIWARENVTVGCDDTYSLDYNISLKISSELYMSAVARELVYLNTSDCIKLYATAFPTNQGNLILVTQNTTGLPNMAVYNAEDATQPNGFMGLGGPFDWMCNQISEWGTSLMKLGGSGPCSQALNGIDPSDWRPFRNKVDYCLTQPVTQKCNVSMSPSLMGIILAFNLAKGFLLLYTFYFVQEAPLMTLGDAIASFVEKEDATTKDLCLLSNFQVSVWEKSCLQQDQHAPQVLPRIRRRWFSAVGRRRWLLLLTLYTIMLAICAALLYRGLYDNIAGATWAVLAAPFGAADPSSFITWAIPTTDSIGLLSNVFVANTPQVILSLIYFTYNGLFTCFMVGAEWRAYADHRKGLRVSVTPVGEQEATYFLGLPLTWAVPITILSTVMHWLASQSLFLVSIDFDHSTFGQVIGNGDLSCRKFYQSIGVRISDYDGWNNARQTCLVSYFTCGYSAHAIIAFIVLGVSLILVALLLGTKKYKNAAMPVVGTCSAAISASCHSRSDTEVATSALDECTGKQSRKLQWGVIDGRPPLTAHQNNDDPSEDAMCPLYVGHCGFSDKEVGVPEEGQLYK